MTERVETYNANVLYLNMLRIKLHCALLGLTRYYMA